MKPTPIPAPDLDRVVEFVRAAADQWEKLWQISVSDSDVLAQAEVALYLYERYRDPSAAWDGMPEDITQLGLVGFGKIVEHVARQSTKESMMRAQKTVATLSATERAHQRHGNSSKQVAKGGAYSYWQEWQRRKGAGHDPYGTKAEFARDMLEKFPVLISQKVIERWCGKWEQGDEIPASDTPRSFLIQIGR